MLDLYYCGKKYGFDPWQSTALDTMHSIGNIGKRARERLEKLLGNHKVDVVQRMDSLRRPVQVEGVPKSLDSKMAWKTYDYLQFLFIILLPSITGIPGVCQVYVNIVRDCAGQNN